MGEVGKGMDYLKSLPSILKLIELVVLLIGAGTVGFFYNELGIDKDYKKKDNLKFYLAVVAIAGIVVLASFLTFFCGLHKKIKAINWTKAAVGTFGLIAVLLLIASALLADAVKYYEDEKFCDVLELGGKFGATDARCKHLIAGVVCGFIAMVFFIADTFIHFRM